MSRGLTALQDAAGMLEALATLEGLVDEEVPVLLSSKQSICIPFPPDIILRTAG
jgi:hypothetical protein